VRGGRGWEEEGEMVINISSNTVTTSLFFGFFFFFHPFFPSFVLLSNFRIKLQ
jgi:hypothetical protein